MAKMRELVPVDADYATGGPNQNTIVQPIGVSASTLFNCLADGPAWNEWLGIEVEWTSPEPHGVGTTRTVTTGNGQRIDEYFVAWDAGERMAFRFDRTTLPMNAFAEQYDCVSTGDGRCELRWSYAYEWGGPLPSVLGKLFGVGFGLMAKRSAKKLAALLEGDPDRFA